MYRRGIHDWKRRRGEPVGPAGTRVKTAIDVDDVLEDSLLIQKSTFTLQASLPIPITISPDPEGQILKSYESDDELKLYEALSKSRQNLLLWFNKM